VLATLAGRTVVDAATADEWETARCRFARLLGRGDAKQTLLAEQRLEETREKLIGATGTDAGLIRAALGVGWATRLMDFLEENPDTEADLQTLVQEIQAVPPAETAAVPPAETAAVPPAETATVPPAETLVVRPAETLAVPPAETLSASNHAASGNGAVSTDAAQGALPEHPGALAARSELAYSTGLAGDAAGARDQFAALLPVAERVLGPEHPDTLATRASLAYWTGHAGDAGAARDQFAALLPVAERVLGPEHPDKKKKISKRDNTSKKMKRNKERGNSGK